MLIEEFRRALTAFADRPADLDAQKGELVIQVNDELIEARIRLAAGEILVEEGGAETSAPRWIVQRIARLPMLAERIVESISASSFFVPPSGQLLDHLDHAARVEDIQVPDAAESIMRVLSRQVAGATSVLYLTSDAGEGKTTLINELSRRQAIAYREKRTDWLLVPIPLGGRSFLRFDDVVTAALVNRFRYRQLFYDGFLELVRLGVVVPAFDGFEEMFIEGSSGEAVSALGGLVRSLRDSGTVMVAARKAFFEYQSFSTQTKLFDTLGGANVHVTFARLALHRWTKDQFLQYARARKVEQPVELYQTVAARLGEGHPMLTRAVLVRRLIDVAGETNNVARLLEKIGTVPEDYFFHFVSALVEREANEKWLDKNSEATTPLLTVQEHHELLGQVAYEMWVGTTDSVKGDMLDAVADLFSHERRKSASTARQIQDRLRHHSLLVSTGPTGALFSFDHEDYRNFYLGESLGPALKKGSRQELVRLLQVNQLNRDTIDHAAASFIRSGGDVLATLRVLSDMAGREAPASFARENAGGISIALLSRSGTKKVGLRGLSFPPDSLRGRYLEDIEFEDCYFLPTAYPVGTVHNCTFRACRFDRLELQGSAAGSGIIDRCEIGSLLNVESDEQFFSPAEIGTSLRSLGFEVITGVASVPVAPEPTADPDVRLAEKGLRVFLRANQVNENVLRQKLGSRFAAFDADVLPKLLAGGVLEQIPYLGSGSQRRFRLAVPLQHIQRGLSSSGVNLEKFIRLVRQPD